MLHGEHRVFDVRPGVALTDCTAWELMLKLEEQGWEWRKLPPGQANRAALAYDLDRSKVWYSAGTSVHKTYLLALLSATELFRAGVPYILHGQSARFYQKLLDEKALPLPRALCAAVPGRIEYDLEVDAAAPSSVVALEPEEMLTLEDEDGAGVLDLGGGLAAFMEQDESDEEGLRNPLRKQADEEGLQEQEEEQEQEPPVGGMEAAAPQHPHSDLPQTGMFGAFRFTRKQKGYQARCPFHRKSTVTECKKFMAVSGSSRAEATATWQKLAFWCVRALTFSRQRHHVAFNPSLEECPRVQEIISMKITEGPQGHVKTDIELDEEARLAADEQRGGAARAGRRGKGCGRGRGSRGGRQGAAAVAPAAEASASPSGSSVCTESDSSSGSESSSASSESAP